MRSIAGVIAVAVLALTAAAPAQAETLSGTVSGQKGSETEPLSEVTVSVFDPSTGTEVGSTSTGVGGDYTVKLPSGVFDVRFDPGPESPFDATTVHEVDTSKPHTLSVVLVPGKTIKLTGTLRNAAGSPVPGAKVFLGSIGASTTNSAGIYSFAVVSPGAYGIRASSSDAIPGLPKSWNVQFGTVELKSDQVHDLALPPTSTLTVEALGEEDEPIPGASVGLPLFQGATGMEGLGLTSVTATDNAATNAQGRASLRLFTGGAPESEKGLARISPPAASGYGPTDFAVPAIDQDVTVVVRPPRTIKLTGTLRNAAGSPVPGAKVFLGSIGASTTNSAGIYSFAVVSPGAYGIRASSSDAIPGLPKSWNVQFGTVELKSDQVHDLALPPTSTLTVEALGEEDEPIPGASVGLPLFQGATGMEGLGLTSVTATDNAATNAQGRASLRLFTGGAPESEKGLARISPPAASGYGPTDFAVPAIDQDVTVVVRFQDVEEEEKDTEAPVLKVEAQPNGQNGWFISSPALVLAHASDPAIATLTCEANGEGIELDPTASPGVLEMEFALEEGRHKVTCGANDASGNTAQETIAVLIDATSPSPPVLSADREPDYAGAGGWYRDEVTVSFSDAGDPDLADETPGSGVDSGSLPAPVTFSTSGAHEASGTVTDVAGNVSNEAALTVNVDATSPSSAYSCPASVALGATVSATWKDSDGESGLQGAATGSQKLDTSSAGAHESTHVATDLVGHTTTSSCQYDVVYAFAIEGNTKQPPAFNKRGNKKQLAIKFSLGGDQGLDVFREGFPAVQPIDCKDGQPVGSPFPATAVKPLSYNAKKDFYEYLWNLSSLGKKDCVALQLGFDDGTTPEIWLTL